MHYYPHNIADFNNSTRHLTRVERSVYRDAIERYYDTEEPLPGDDFDKLARVLLCQSVEEKAALEVILDDFFTLDDGLYTHERCDIEIEKYRAKTSAKARAGKASAESRRKAKEGKAKPKGEQKGTRVEQVLNDCATDEQLTKNQEPITNNQEPVKDKDSVPSGTASQPVPYQAVVDLYHEVLQSLSSVRRLDSKRKSRIRQVHADPMDKSLENWRAYFAAVFQSDFLMGRIEGKDWRADFDFLLTEKAVTGVIEGKYHAKNKSSGNAQQYSARALTPGERVKAKRFAAGSPDVGAVVENVGNVRPYLVEGSGR